MRLTTFDRVQEIRSLNDMLQAHVEWKVRLRSAVRGREVLDVTMIRLDSVCKMGTWLYGEGSRWGELADELKASHAEFHLAAANIADACNAGHFELAEQMMGPGSAYMKTSSAVRKSIFDLVSRSRQEQARTKTA